ncbi:MAG: biotin--[acetyl-CoA-carboxylase] ligase [Dysgonamonadaceae bacterium]|nr:biotin--[acetyl-CoA-carboxylase] ligase [Dysgonamonadaceae bacterium]
MNNNKMSGIVNHKELLSVNSTNDYLMALACITPLEECFAVSALSQTAGKGQRGNSWLSAPGKNITFSIIFYPDFLQPSQSFLLSETVALGVRDAVNELVDSVEIKWPNDIFYHNRKLGGILIENSLIENRILHSIAGIGLNINQKHFGANMPLAVSIAQLLDREIEIKPLLARLIDAIRSRYAALRAGDFDVIRNDYHAALYRKEGFFAYKDANGRFEAKINHVSDDGQLHLIDSQGNSRCYWHKQIIQIITP